jgi:hydroxymethylpyrimidine pyrophosphatase-like HAD family hydrolase
LAPAPDDAFIQELQRRHVVPLYLGRVIVATAQEHEETVREVIRRMHLDSHIIPNKGAVMVLPRGIDKATGLRAALAEFGLSAERAVGVGDAENDDVLLAACGLGVAVANALPELKAQAHWVTPSEAGAGVAELIERLLADNLGHGGVDDAGENATS